MNKQEFNECCAEVIEIDYKKVTPDNGGESWVFTNYHGEYNPYDDANQRHEVFDKLRVIYAGKRLGQLLGCLIRDIVNDVGIDQAEREFIWSTKENTND